MSNKLLKKLHWFLLRFFYVFFLIESKKKVTSKKILSIWSWMFFSPYLRQYNFFPSYRGFLIDFKHGSFFTFFQASNKRYIYFSLTPILSLSLSLPVLCIRQKEKLHFSLNIFFLSFPIPLDIDGKEIENNNFFFS